MSPMWAGFRDEYVGARKGKYSKRVRVIIE